MPVGEFMLQLRDYQEKAIEKLREGFAQGHRTQLLYLGTGGGKTEIAIAMLEAARKKGSRAAMILDRIVLCDQTSRRLDKYHVDHGVLQAGHWRYKPYEPIQVCSAQTLEKRGTFPGLDLLVVDECFPGDTLIETVKGKVRIDKIKDGELVYNATGLGVVRSVFSKTVFSTVIVELSNGKKFECTHDHPIFTDLGWRPAGTLARGTQLFCKETVRALWQGDAATNHQFKKGRNNSRSRNFIQQASFLRQLLREEIEQPDAQSRASGKNIEHVEENWTQTEDKERQWKWAYANRENDVGKIAEELDCGICCENFEEASAGVSASLQVRFGFAGSENLFRVGRREPLHNQTASTGSEERCVVEVVRVESVQTVEHPSGKVVFNLRVGGHPSYFADGFLVHNCHAQRKQTIEFIKNNPTVKVVGLSASPFTKGLANTYSNVVSPITTKQLVEQGSLVPLRVFIAKEVDMTGAKKVAGEWSQADATERGIKITGDVVTEWSKKTREIFGEPRKTIVFAAGVAHGADLAAKFQEQGYNFVSISYKDDEDWKRDVIDDFAKPDSKIIGLIACDILTKGFDNEHVMIGVSARPFSKSFSSHVQQMGRVMRANQSDPKSKPFAVWLDHSGNYLRFREDWDQLFDSGVAKLEDGKEKPKKELTEKEKKDSKCPVCQSLWVRGSDTCYNCGHVKEKTNLVLNVDGEMQELTSVGREDKQRFWNQMVWLIRYKGWSRGRAGHTYRDRFGVWPRGLNDNMPEMVSLDTKKFIDKKTKQFLRSIGK